MGSFCLPTSALFIGCSYFVRLCFHLQLICFLQGRIHQFLSVDFLHTMFLYNAALITDMFVVFDDNIDVVVVCSSDYYFAVSSHE